MLTVHYSIVLGLMIGDDVYWIQHAVYEVLEEIRVYLHGVQHLELSDLFGNGTCCLSGLPFELGWCRVKLLLTLVKLVAVPWLALWSVMTLICSIWVFIPVFRIILTYFLEITSLVTFFELLLDSGLESWVVSYRGMVSDYIKHARQWNIIPVDLPKQIINRFL